MTIKVLCREVERHSQKLVRARGLRLGREFEQSVLAFTEDSLVGRGEITSARRPALLDGVGEHAPGESASLAGKQRLEGYRHRSNLIAILGVRYLSLGKPELVELGKRSLIRGEKPLHPTGDSAGRRRSWPQIEVIPAARCEHEQLG